MLGDALLIAFVTTSDPEEAKRFYGQVLGLRLVADEPFALVFEGGGTMLRVAKVDAAAPSASTVLGWRVSDIEGVVAALGARGIVFERFPAMPQDALGICSFPDGGRVAWFRDPDGNLLSVSQFVLSG